MVTKMLNFNYISQLVPKIQVIVQQKIAETGMLSIQRNDVEEYKAFDLLELTTTIASTVMLELFFGGSSFDAGSLNIKGVKLNHFIRHTFDLLLKQLLSPMSSSSVQRSSWASAATIEPQSPNHPFPRIHSKIHNKTGLITRKYASVGAEP